MLHQMPLSAAIIFIIFATTEALPGALRAYDARALRPGCTAWSQVLSQGEASSCCAAAMATSLSLRECLRDGRDTMYSAQQIWDCSGSAISSVKNGTLLQSLIDAMLESGDHFLVRHECAPTMLNTEPSSDRCENTCPGEMTHPITTSSTFWLSGDDTGAAARQHMMEEIMQNGPVLAVLAFPTDSDLIKFRKLGPHHVFVPSSHTDAAAVSYHCIVVYGWGTGEDGQAFWRVQNSYGHEWGDYGLGRVGFGTLERNWRSVSTPRSECVASLDQLCILPPLLPAAAAPNFFSAMLAYIMPGGNSTRDDSWANNYYYNNYYHSLNVTNLKRYYKDTLSMHYHTVTTAPNSAIVGVTLLSALVIVCLLFMFIPGAEAPPAAPAAPGKYYCYYVMPPSQPWRSA